MNVYRLDFITNKLGGELIGDADFHVNHLVALRSAQVSAQTALEEPGGLSFLAHAKYKPAVSQAVQDNRVQAIIVNKSEVDFCQALGLQVIVVENPYLAYAQVSELFKTLPQRATKTHPTAVVAETAQLAKGVSVGAYAVIGEHVVIGKNSVIDAHVVVGDNTTIGDNTHIFPHVSLYHDVRIGNAVTIHANTVIGSDGFGFSPSPTGWIKIHQIGRVIIGDHVEIGANTSIDRGAIDDTVIGNNVIMDNQIQIAHNVQIGDGTAIAANTGIAGSTRIGKNCLIGGAVAIAGHLEIVDNVHISGQGMVVGSIREAGLYSSGIPADKHRNWLKNAVRFKKSAQLFKRVDAIEEYLKKRGNE